MKAFWADAASIFETASQAARAGSPDCNWAVLISPEGHIRTLDATGWTMAGLAAEHAGETVYHVSRKGAEVRVEARSSCGRCLLESRPPAVAARQLLGASPSLPDQIRSRRELAALAPPAPTNAEGVWPMFA